MKRLAGLLATVLLAAAPAGYVAAQEDQDGEYSDQQALISINAVPCDAPEVTGAVEGAQPGSTVTVRLVLNPVLDTVTVTAGADGTAPFKLDVPADRFGRATVEATGLDGDGDPFTISATVNLRACPVIPSTGNSNSGTILRAGGGALLLGGMLVALGMRRRRAIA